MTEKELLAAKIKAAKNWLWLLTNSSDENLNLPFGLSKEEAINDALDELRYLMQKHKNFDDEK